MKVEVIREEVKPVQPPVKEVVLRLSAEEARSLYEITNWPESVSKAVNDGFHHERIRKFVISLFTTLRTTGVNALEW